MIDLTFHFTKSTEEEKLILDSELKSQGLSNPNIRYFTGRRWNNRGIAAVLIDNNVCTILNVKMQKSVSAEFSDVYFFYEHLIYNLLNFAKRVEWKRNEPELHNDFLQVIAAFDKKLVGEGRIRTAYNAGVTDAADGVLYYVEKHKKVFVRRLQKPRKDKTEPLTLSRAETGLPVDIADVQSWSSVEFGRMEYIVLKKKKEEYCLFPSNNEEKNVEDNHKDHEMEKIFNFFADDYEDTCFTKEEIETVRQWMNMQLKDENSTLSRYFAQRRLEDENHLKEFASRIQKDKIRRDENLARLNSGCKK